MSGNDIIGGGKTLASGNPPAKRGWESLSADQLNVQYDVEATVADFGALVGRIVDASADVRAHVTHRLNVRYGPTLSETYDVFLPTEKASVTAQSPALFFIHGGYWKATTSKEWSFIAAALTRLGFVVIVENYALLPDVSMQEIARQHRAAFAHFWKNAAEYGVDFDRVVIAGHSAGAHAVSMLIDTDWEWVYGLPAVSFKGALLVSGLYDLRPLQKTFLRPLLGMTDREAVSLSPILDFPAQFPPMAIAVGSRETGEFERQSRDYHAALQAKGHQSELLILESDHFDIMDEMMSESGVLTRKVVELAS